MLSIVNQPTPEDFVEWLRQILDFNADLKSLNETQTKILKDKLARVFHKVTPTKNYLNTPQSNFEQVMTGKPSYCLPVAGESPQIALPLAWMTPRSC